MARVTIEGVTKEMDDVIAGDDELLKKVLGTSFGNIKDADIVRGTKDGVMEVTIVKRAKSKGSIKTQEKIAAELLAAPEYINPAVEFALKKLEAENAGDKSFMFRAMRSGEAARAATAGHADAHEAEVALFKVANTAPVPSKDVPLGF